jgi:hypothetical protein
VEAQQTTGVNAPRQNAPASRMNPAICHMATGAFVLEMPV